MVGGIAKVETLNLVQPEQTHLYIFLHPAYLCSLSFQKTKNIPFLKKNLQITHKYESVLQTTRYYANIDIDFSTMYTQGE